MDRQASASNDAGFTLVEFIVALALLALTFSALAAVMGFATRATGRAVSSNDQIAIYAANRFMRDTIARALPLYVLRPGRTQPELQFKGTKTSLSFVANLPGRTTVGGTHIIGFELRPSGEGGSAGAVVVSQRVYRPSRAVNQNPAKARDFLRAVKTLTFSYYGVKTRGQRPRWFDTWTTANRLPQLIALDVTFEDGKRWTWPSTKILLVRGQKP